MNHSPPPFLPVAQFIALGTLFLSLAACSNQSNTSSSAQPTGTNAANSSNSGVSGSTMASTSTPETPSGTSTPPTTPPTSPPATPTEPTLSDKIKTLEDNGTIPKLDRSADIKGPDVNNNGVRDDIDVWIAALPITEKQKKAATQTAIGLQRTLVIDLKDKAAMDASGEELMASTACLSNVFLPNYQESFKLSGKIEAMTANTKTRAYRYMEYNRAASGSSTMYPTGNTCK